MKAPHICAVIGKHVCRHQWHRHTIHIDDIVHKYLHTNKESNWMRTSKVRTCQYYAIYKWRIQADRNDNTQLWIAEFLNEYWSWKESSCSILIAFIFDFGGSLFYIPYFSFFFSFNRLRKLACKPWCKHCVLWINKIMNILCIVCVCVPICCCCCCIYSTNFTFALLTTGSFFGLQFLWMISLNRFVLQTTCSSFHVSAHQNEKESQICKSIYILLKCKDKTVEWFYLDRLFYIQIVCNFWLILFK